MGEPVKAFTATPLEGKRKKTVYSYDGGKRIEKEVDEPAGHMVQFPRGHSIRVATSDRMEFLGFTEDAGFVDLEDTVQRPKHRGSRGKSQLEQLGDE